MSENQNNYAFIDSQNVNLAIRDQGWILDFRRFRNRYSSLLRKFSQEIVFMNDLRGKLEYKRQ